MSPGTSDTIEPWMKKAGFSIGVILSVVLAVAAAVLIGFAFMNSASPYVSIKEAKLSAADDLHVAGNLDKGTLETDVRAGKVTFTLTDDAGDRLPVIYSGAPIANMGEATKIVAIGKYENGTFQAHKLLVKCPSKYEAELKDSA